MNALFQGSFFGENSLFQGSFDGVNTLFQGSFCGVNTLFQGSFDEKGGDVVVFQTKEVLHIRSNCS